MVWEQNDIDAALPLVRDCQERWPELCAVSFDRGFHSPHNRQTLDQILKLKVLPAKGRLSAEAQERENAFEFLAARNQHSAAKIHRLGKLLLAKDHQRQRRTRRTQLKAA